MNAMQHALDLASRGFPAFPCLETKRPACPHGFKDATSNPDAIRALWQRHPGPLIGVPTGEASGVAVLDIDPAGLAWHDQHKGRLPVTFCYQTRRHGFHHWFQHHSGLKSSAGKIAPGIDVRADGGYVIYWPVTGLPTLCDAPPAPWPSWLMPAAKLAQAPSYAPGQQYSANARPPEHVEASLIGLVRYVATAEQGTRNDRLFWAARKMVEMTARRELGRAHAEAALIEAASRCGLDHIEASRTIASAYNGGR